MPIRSPVKTLGAGALSATGFPRFWHRQFHSAQITILMYHGVVQRPLPVADWCFLQEQSFRQQLVYLKKHFRVLSLSQAVKALKEHAVEDPTAVLTFDDGYQNNYDVAFPLLCEYAVPATIFLATHFMDSIDIPWYCRLNRALEHTQEAALDWQGNSWDLADARKKAYASSVLQEKLKRLSAYDLNAALIAIMKKLAVDPSPFVPDGSPFQMLRTSAIKAMRASGLIEFGAHTHSHAILSQLSFEEQRREIKRSLERVEELTGERCTLFAYPNGRAQDYDEKSLLVLKAAGIEAALTTVPGPNDTSTPLLELRRYPVGANANLATFQLMVHHCLYDYRKMVSFSQ